LDGLTGITTGPDDNLWFTETLANRAGGINPTTHAIAEFFLPTASSCPASITSSPDGNLTFTESGRQNFNLDNPFRFIPYGASAIGEINPATHAITTFATPSVNSNPLGITVGPDGSLWFAE
jgi:virginiamycin B lyase